jgi:hypothetical protein
MQQVHSFIYWLTVQILMKQRILQLDLMFSQVWLWTVLTLFWDATQCSPVEFHRRFGGMYYLHLECTRASQYNSKQSSACLIVRPWMWGSTFLRNVGELLPDCKGHIPEDRQYFECHSDLMYPPHFISWFQHSNSTNFWSKTNAVVLTNLWGGVDFIN